MAKSNTTTTIAYPLIIAAIFAAATAQVSPGHAPALPISPVAPGPYGGASSPAPDCFMYLLNLSDCLTFVEGGSNLTKPDPGCCPALANLVVTQPICLCQLLGNPGQVGVTVDINRALKLPSVCNVTTPPVSFCSAIGVPVGALTPNEAPSPAATGVESHSPGAPQAAVPSPGGGNGSPSGSLATKHHFLIGLAALFFTYFF